MNMEITLDAIISLIGLFVGGGGGAFFMWRWQNRKAKAEAETAEVETVKSMQDAYERMFEQVNHYLEDATGKVEGLRAERDHYREERDELRDKLDKLTKLFYDLKTEGERERSELRVSINKLSAQMKGIIPLTCDVTDCKLRHIITFLEDGGVKLNKPTDIQRTDKTDEKTPRHEKQEAVNIEPSNEIL